MYYTITSKETPHYAGKDTACGVLVVDAKTHRAAYGIMVVCCEGSFRVNIDEVVELEYVPTDGYGGIREYQMKDFRIYHTETYPIPHGVHLRTNYQWPVDTDELPTSDYLIRKILRARRRRNKVLRRRWDILPIHLFAPTFLFPACWPVVQSKLREDIRFIKEIAASVKEPNPVTR